MRRGVAVAVFAIVVVAVVVVAVWLSAVTVAIGAVVSGALLSALAWSWVGRNQRAWGYTERADDLLVRRGLAFRQLIVVPYGRMQFVDVTAGPLQRKFGLATVQLHTAAAKTDARIPGLTPSAAATLRDRLAARGEARAAGL
jgi:uncharacterized protein